MKPIEGSVLPGLNAPFSFDWNGETSFSQFGMLMSIEIGIRSRPSVYRARHQHVAHCKLSPSV